MKITPPPDIQKKLGDRYAAVLVKAEQTMNRCGRESFEYAIALAVAVATIETVQVCLGFETAKDTEKYLNEIIKT